MYNKFLVVDRDDMKFLAVAATIWQASNLAQIDHPGKTVAILPIDQARYFTMFGRLELMMLYKNQTGETVNVLEGLPILVQTLYQLANEMPVDGRTLADLTKPNMPAEPVGWQTFHPAIAGADPVRDYPATSTYKPKGQPGEPKEKAPRDPNAKPSPKGATGKVWEIADRVWQECGGGVITKDTRAKIIKACEETGIHPATAATQYSKWKATK